MDFVVEITEQRAESVNPFSKYLKNASIKIGFFSETAAHQPSFCDSFQPEYFSSAAFRGQTSDFTSD